MMAWLRRDLGWKLLALGIAALLWIALNREEEVETVVSAPVQFRNLADGFEITSGAPRTILIHLRGPSGRLARSDLASLAVVLDCSQAVKPGAYTFNISSRQLRRPFGVAFTAAEPSQLQITVERTVSREVPVAPTYASPPPPGYAIASFTESPDRVRVSGPESHVRLIEAVGTDPINLDGVVSRTELHLAAHLPDPDLRLDPSTPLITYRVVLERVQQKGKAHDNGAPVIRH